MTNPEVWQRVYTVGAQPVGSLLSGRPMGDSMPSRPAGLSTHPAYAQQCLAPPVPAQSFVPGSVTMAPVAPPLCAGLSSSVVPAPPCSVGLSMPMAALGADTRPTFVSLGAPV